MRAHRCVPDAPVTRPAAHPATMPTLTPVCPVLAVVRSLVDGTDPCNRGQVGRRALTRGAAV